MCKECNVEHQRLHLSTRLQFQRHHKPLPLAPSASWNGAMSCQVARRRPVGKVIGGGRGRRRRHRRQLSRLLSEMT